MPYIPPPGQVPTSEPLREPELPRPRRRRRGWSLRLTPAGFLLLLVLNLLLIGGLVFGLGKVMGWPIFPLEASPTSTASQTSFPATTVAPAEDTPTTLPPTSTATLPADTPTPYAVTDLAEGLILLALDDSGYTHLFAYQPQESSTSQPLPAGAADLWPVG